MTPDLSTEAGRAEFFDQAERVKITLEQFSRIFIDQVEYTRRIHHISKRYMSHLLGVSEGFYGKMTQHERNVQAIMVINYCRIFGMDISGITNESLLRESDPVIRETAMYMASLSNETLHKIEETIQQSNESDIAKQRGKKLLDKMCSIEVTDVHAYGSQEEASEK